MQETQSSAVTPILTGVGVDERYARNDVIGRTYFLTDALGSTLALTNGNGEVKQRYSYDPYGNASESDTTSGFTNPYQYTGREADAPGLYYYRARYYSPVIGGFISEDPAGFLGGQASFYAYVYGNPVNYIDPLGLDGLDPLWGAIYDATGGWSPSQTTVNVVVGFGDGVYNGITLGLGDLQDVRDVAGIDGGVDPCSDEYKIAKIAGQIEGAAALGGAVASKAFRPGGWTNSNRYLRVGFGRNGGNQTFRAAGQWVQKVTGRGHVDFWNGGPL